MKLRLEESEPGEFVRQTPAELMEKARGALHEAIHAATGARAEDLRKGGGLRGGEMKVVEELAERMQALYARRMQELAAELDRTLGGK